MVFDLGIATVTGLGFEVLSTDMPQAHCAPNPEGDWGKGSGLNLCRRWGARLGLATLDEAIRTPDAPK